MCELSQAAPAAIPICSSRAETVESGYKATQSQGCPRVNWIHPDSFQPNDTFIKVFNSHEAVQCMKMSPVISVWRPLGRTIGQEMQFGEESTRRTVAKAKMLLLPMLGR